MSAENSPKREEKYKVIVVGDTRVGKTSLIRKYTENKFKKDYLPTIGVNLCKYTLQYPDKSVILIFWDIAGQQTFDKMHRGYFQGASGIIHVFDLTNKETLENVQNWQAQCDHYGVGHKPKVLVGNKLDLEADRGVPRASGEAMATSLKASYFETSALTGIHVNEIMRAIYESMAQED